MPRDARSERVDFGWGEPAESDAQRARIVLADDDEDLRTVLATALREDGYDVREVKSGAELLEMLNDYLRGPHSRETVDLVVTDMRMPGRDGLEVLAALREVDWATPLVLITAFGDRSIHVEASRLGVAAVLDKPFALKEFRATVARLVEPTGGLGLRV